MSRRNGVVHLPVDFVVVLAMLNALVLAHRKVQRCLWWSYVAVAVCFAGVLLSWIARAAVCQ